MTLLRGIDISGQEHDANLLNGVDFVFLKATQGDWEDVTFNGTGTWDGKRYFRFLDVQSSDAIAGAFHFLIRTDKSPTPELQAARFYNAIRRANTGILDGVLCAVMVEHALTWRSVPREDDVKRFIEEWQRLAGNHPLFIYTNAPYWLAQVKFDLRRYDHVYLWLAYWTDTSGDINTLRPMLPQDAWTRRIGGLTPTIIQFTSQARAGETRVRGNLYRGDKSSLARMAWPQIPKPSATTAYKQRWESHPVFPKPDPDPKTRRKLFTASVVIGSAAIVLAFAFGAWWIGRKRIAPIFENENE